MEWFELIKKHWKLAIFISAIILAGFIGRMTAPKPAPAVELHQTIDHEGTSNNEVQIVKVEGPVVIQKHIIYSTKTVPGQTQPCDAIVTEDTTETHGQVTTATNSNETKHEVDHTVVDLKITPAPVRPGWAIGVGIDDPIGARHLRLELDRRLMGNLWIGIAAVPASHDLGVMLKLEF